VEQGGSQSLRGPRRRGGLQGEKPAEGFIVPILLSESCWALWGKLVPEHDAAPRKHSERPALFVVQRSSRRWMMEREELAGQPIQDSRHKCTSGSNDALLLPAITDRPLRGACLLALERDTKGDAIGARNSRQHCKAPGCSRLRRLRPGFTVQIRDTGIIERRPWKFNSSRTFRVCVIIRDGRDRDSHVPRTERC
jgi:hypothetical protein